MKANGDSSIGRTSFRPIYHTYTDFVALLGRDPFTTCLASQSSLLNNVFLFSSAGFLSFLFRFYFGKSSLFRLSSCFFFRRAFFLAFSFRRFFFSPAFVFFPISFPLPFFFVFCITFNIFHSVSILLFFSVIFVLSSCFSLFFSDSPPLFFFFCGYFYTHARVMYCRRASAPSTAQRSEPCTKQQSKYGPIRV